ncbi:diaminopimelate epimerase [Alphaproteobacteria bacterium]|nr:diaminopimelate epimerase [Alphaproteobacteria bacterium]
MNIPFVKMHVNGNDFVIIDNRIKKNIFKKLQISSLANRNTGIGFDQLILLENSNTSDVLMKIYNSDGTEAEMCGNAASCVASLLFASKNTGSISIETISTNIIAELNSNGGVSTTVMLPNQNFLDIIINKDIDVTNIDLSKIHSTFSSGKLVNMGNPHIVFIVNNLEEVDLLKYGKKIEKNKLFVDGINTEVVEIINRKKLKIKFWERGAGLTLSCGSGILSAFYACYKIGLCEKSAEIILPLGRVNTKINDDKLTIISIPEVSFLGEFDYE